MSPEEPHPGSPSPAAGVDPAQAPPSRDRYPDALRAGALLVVVFGHWIATLPRLEGGRMVDAEHLLTVWDGAGVLSWGLQVVPLFVFVSAAVSADGTARRIREGQRHLLWWGGRALGLARPTVTFFAVLAVVALTSYRSGGGRLLDHFDTSFTVHLWFLVMLLAVQAVLPLSVRADDRWGLRAVAGLLIVAVVVDLARAGITSPSQVVELGALVTGRGGGIGWVNALVVWLLPQQLGIAWRRGRLGGLRDGIGLGALGLVWLGASVASGYPVAMVGGDLAGNSNVLPPTLALVGVMWLQAGAAVAFEGPGRRALARRPVGKAVAILGALGMPLYLWHKLAELPAAFLGETIGAPIDAGVPGQAGFWVGRATWLGLCLVSVTPIIIAVVWFETRRTKQVPATTSTPAVVIGGVALLAAIVTAMAVGTDPGGLVGLPLVLLASYLLRRRGSTAGLSPIPPRTAR
ncbi:MAG TPA: acyltransferase [Euzebya sp.]|nr:acyltransferase [Euzebya sp.]